MKRIAGETMALMAAGWSLITLESVVKYGPAVGATVYYGVKIWLKIKREIERKREAARRQWDPYSQ